jgi:hypothetical protein
MAEKFPEMKEIKIPSIENAEEFKVEHKALNKLRGIARRRITIAFKQLYDKNETSQLTLELCNIQINKIQTNLAMISGFNVGILDLFD